MIKVNRVKGDADRNFKIAIQDIKGKIGKVGWFENSKYENGFQVAMAAAISEYGWPQHNIPPRPMLRPTIIREEAKWKRLIAAGVSAILKGNVTSTLVMESLVEKAAGDVKQTISQIYDPPLKESTIRARRSKRKDKKTVGRLTKPLIDSGILLGSVLGRVEKR